MVEEDYGGHLLVLDFSKFEQFNQCRRIVKRQKKETAVLNYVLIAVLF